MRVVPGMLHSLLQHRPIVADSLRRLLTGTMDGCDNTTLLHTKRHHNDQNDLEDPQNDSSKDRGQIDYII